tara:strand:- start:3494 stop:3943 length:450 start_codon:yes stop_codon:yes gene_type:complete
MQSNKNITLFSQKHINFASTIYTEVFNSKPWNETWTIKSATKRLTYLHTLKNSFGLCYVDNKKCIGFLIGHSEPYLNNTQFIINELCVSSSFQKKGIATLLLQYLENHLKENKIKYMMLTTKKTTILNNFYKKNGFKNLDNIQIFIKEI